MISPWPEATSTGVGSLPGTDPAMAAGLAFDVVSLPFLPELPERGVGADLIARGTALLAGLYVDLQPSGWRLVPRPGRDASRTADLLARDIDAFTEAGEKYEGPLKLQACGPWTLAVGLEMSRGGQALADPAATHDLAESLAEGLREHVAVIRSRIPGITEIVLQLDEPSLPAVLAGHVRTASGFATLRTPESREIATVLRMVLDAVPDAVAGVHCCAAGIPVSVLVGAGARFVSMDVTALRESPLDDELGEALEAGVALIAGAVPTAGMVPPVAAVVAPVRALWRRLGLPVNDLAGVAVSPACGLPGRTPEEARAALVRAREAAENLAGG